MDNNVKKKDAIAFPQWTVPQYELAACGGDGLFVGDTDIPYTNIHVANKDADFAVTISGCSMEPTLPNGCVILVSKVEELNNKDIGIFIINGDSMCKRYNEYDGKVVLTPDNESEEFESIEVSSDISFIIQGRFLAIHKQPNT